MSGATLGRVVAAGIVAAGLGIIAAALWLAIPGQPSAPAQPPPSIPDSADQGPPNVVFILMDTLRADRIDAKRKGEPVMPNLASLAEKSWRFSDCLSPESWTKPSVVSIFTSLYPGVHNVQYGVDARIVEGQSPEVDILPGGFEVMPELFQDRGYHTEGIQANANVQAEMGFDQGFDAYYFEAYPELRADEMTDRGIEAMKNAEEPVFLYLQYMDPHSPYDAPEQHKTAFGALPELSTQDRALVEDYNTYYNDMIFHELGVTDRRESPDLSSEGKEYIRWMYDAECRFLDHEVARLMNAVLEEAPETVFVLTSDHGEELWEHGLIGHGTTVYQEVVHVPLLFMGPGIPQGSTDFPAQTVDILPTLAGHLDWTPDPAWQGVNLLQLAQGETGDDLERIRYTRARSSLRITNIKLDGLIDHAFKFIEDERRGEAYLFNLDDDPGETSNLASGQPAKTDLYRALLAGHRDENEGHAMYNPGGQTASISGDTVEALENIGYGGRVRSEDPEEDRPAEKSPE